MLIAQITDCHVVEAGELLYDRLDTAAMLAAAVTHINEMVPRPDLVLATGDLVNDGRRAQYDQLLSVLENLQIPLYAIPGNHDDRNELRARFDNLPGGGPDDPVDYVVDDYGLRLVALDTIIPGHHDGEITDAQGAWLDDVLSSERTRPTLIFQHHPPFLTGISWMDSTGLAGREMEADIVRNHSQVKAIVCGHIHRPVQTLVGTAVASTWPSTGAQVALALDGTPYQYSDEPPAIAIHRWEEQTGVVSHTSYVDGTPRWVPPWATEEL